jgi:hypothetical protein
LFIGRAFSAIKVYRERIAKHNFNKKIGSLSEGSVPVILISMAPVDRLPHSPESMPFYEINVVFPQQTNQL